MLEIFKKKAEMLNIFKKNRIFMLFLRSHFNVFFPRPSRTLGPRLPSRRTELANSRHKPTYQHFTFQDERRQRLGSQT